MKNTPTPLHLSCYYGHTTVAKLLIKSKASIKQVAGRKQTFLHKAIISADADFVNVLISTTLEEHGAKDVDELLHLEDMDSNTPLLLAVKRKSPEITEALIDKGVELNHHNSKNIYALHMACSAGSVDVVRLLVNKGANVECRNQLNQTPLMVASEFNHSEIIKCLLEEGGADIEARGDDGMTSLLKASSKGHIEAAQMLGRHNADVYAVDQVRTRAIQYLHQHRCSTLMHDISSGRGALSFTRPRRIKSKWFQCSLVTARPGNSWVFTTSQTWCRYILRPRMDIWRW